MTNSVAEYYLDELYDWKSAIELYLEEIDGSTEWLQSILHFDSVPSLSAKVEHCLGQLLIARESLSRMIYVIQSTERKLYKDQMPITDDNITGELREKHKKLRTEMHKIERAYLDIKYDCDEFLASAVEIQNKIGR